MYNGLTSKKNCAFGSYGVTVLDIACFFFLWVYSVVPVRGIKLQ